jgi:hypothetical protein
MATIDETVKVLMLKGETGTSIESIDKTATDGLIDTYTVKMTDGTESRFYVKNGRDGEKGEKGDTGSDGRGISKIKKTATTGTVDTYTITYTDSTHSTYEVRNSDDVAIQRQIVPSAAVESSTTASQSYSAGDYVVVNGVLRKVKSAIAKGSTISGSNSTATTVTGELAAKKIASGTISALGATFSWEAYSEPGFVTGFVSIVYKRVSGYLSSDGKVNEQTFFSSVSLPAGYRPASKVHDTVSCSVSLTPYTETAVIDTSGRVGLSISSSGALYEYGGFDEACARFKIA